MGQAAAADSPADIVATLKADSRFAMLSAALDDAQLSEALKISASITFFAPTDDAFHKLPDLQALLADKTRLKATLARHFVADHKMFAADLAKMNALVVSDGSTLRIGEEGRRINGAAIVSADIPASNGVIHAIDAVLVLQAPPILAEVRINDRAPTTITTTETVPDNRYAESKNSFKDAGHTISTGVTTGAEKVGDGVKTGAEKVGDSLKTGAGKIKNAFGF